MNKSRTRSLLPPSTQIDAIRRRVISCRLCSRLVAWREKVAQIKVARFANDAYWGKPVPSFGDPKASLIIIGLAPAAHGGNRTGRMFTGDRSGNWLYETLYKTGFANQPTSISRADGLTLAHCFITASLRCAPPLNKPLPVELERCRPYLVQELHALGLDPPHSFRRVIVVLGKVAFDSFLKAYQEMGGEIPKPKPKFGHGNETKLETHLILIASFHPSQQNTFTGKLTREMFEQIFRRARNLALR